MISRISAFRSKPFLTRNPAASLSSSSLLAGLVMRRSSTDSTSATEKKFFHTRLVIEREKYGFSGAVSHLASGARRSSEDVSDMGCASSGVGGWGLPRRGCTRSPVVSAKITRSSATVPFFERTREKRLANAKYWSFVHFSMGWLWHFAQLIDMP